MTFSRLRRRHLAVVTSLILSLACGDETGTSVQHTNAGGSGSVGVGGVGTGSIPSGIGGYGAIASGGAALSSGGVGGVNSGGRFVTGGSGAVGGITPTGGAAGTGALVQSGGTAGTGAVGQSGGVAGTGAAGQSGGVAGTGAVGQSGGTAGTGAVGQTGGTAGTGAGSSGTGGLPPDGTLNDLTIEPNPNSVLSCFVSWTTDQPADSVVQFGATGLEWEIADPALVTSHRVLVIGMYANQTYTIRASSSVNGSEAVAEGSFATDSLPVSIPVADVTVNDTARTQAGWTLMNIQKGDGTATARSQYPAQAVMYDAEGQPVWYYIDGPEVDRGGAVSVDLTDVGVMIGPVMDDSGMTGTSPKEVDFAGNTLWECPNPLCGTTGNLTHHAGKLPNGNYVIQRDMTAGAGTYPVYEVLTPDNQVIWSWDYTQFVSPPANATGDWCHGNSITIDIEHDEVYANCRWMGLVKTTYNNPTFIWHLAASYGASGMGNVTFSPASSQYIDTHDPEIHDDGTVLVYENGGYSGVIGEEGNPHGYHSRALEYQIAETGGNWTATLVWEFPGSFNVDSWYRDTWYIPFWGDADRLENGNVLITAGVRGPSSQSRVFEVTKQDGQVVWEFRLPADYGVYRSERIAPPLLRRL